MPLRRHERGYLTKFDLPQLIVTDRKMLECALCRNAYSLSLRMNMDCVTLVGCRCRRTRYLADTCSAPGQRNRSGSPMGLGSHQTDTHSGCYQMRL